MKSFAERRNNLITIDKQSRVPAYEQVKNQIMTLILIGTFPPHSQLPSIRSIAAGAGLNINTIKKAFSDLESYGVIYTVPGKGSFVSEKAFSNDTVKQSAVSDISAAIEAARAKGIKKQEIINILNEIYTEEVTDND